MIVITVIARQDVDGHFGTTLSFLAGMYIWVGGKGGYGRTQTQTWTISNILLHLHNTFIPNVAFTAAFASKPQASIL